MRLIQTILLVLYHCYRCNIAASLFLSPVAFLEPVVCTYLRLVSCGQILYLQCVGDSDVVVVCCICLEGGKASCRDTHKLVADQLANVLHMSGKSI